MISVTMVVMRPDLPAVLETGSSRAAMLSWDEVERLEAGLVRELGSRLWIDTPRGRRDSLRTWMSAATGQETMFVLEWERGAPVSWVDVVPRDRRILSWTPASRDRRELLRGLDELLSRPAALYRVVVGRKDLANALLARVRAAGRRDVCVYAERPQDVASRVLSATFAAPVLICGSDPPLRPARLQRDFGLPDIPAAEALCGVVGPRVESSLSPCLHNEMYRRAGLPWLFLPLVAPGLGEFLEESALSLPAPLRGLTVTGPLKAEAWELGRSVAPQAARARSANLMVATEDGWRAESVDAELADELVRRGVARPGRRAVVVGCGGSGRAMASALASSGLLVTLSNRTASRGREVAELLQLPFVPLAELELGDADLVVNATPAGALGAPLALDLGRLKRSCAFVDLPCAPSPTAQAEAASRRGLQLIDGLEVLRIQVKRHFEAMTGRAAAIDAAMARARGGLEE